MSRKNSAQKTIHNMLDNDPRYLRPESRIEMDKRISSLSISRSRRRLKRKNQPPSYDENFTKAKEEMASDSSAYEVDPADELDNIELAKDGLVPSKSVPSWANPASASQYSLSASEQHGVAPPSVAGRSGQHTLSYRPPRRQSTVLSTSTEMSTSSIRELQKRVSGCSTRYAKQISTLLKHLTISSASDLTQSPERRPSISDIEPPQPPEPDIFEAFPEPGYALPGDLINAQSLNCAGFPGQDHFNGKCWCSIAKAIAGEKSAWLSPTGDLSPRAQQVYDDPSQANLASRDCFGNTPLHLFAVLEGYQETLFRMVLHSADVGVTNTAGQTFLHVLNFEWFADLKSPSAPLKQLLAYLRDRSPDLVYATDVYGRTFFHRAHSLIRDSEILDGILSPFNPALSSRRDAFGFNPLANTNLGGEGPFIPPRRGALTPLPEEGPSGSRGRNSPRTSNDEDAFIAYHARLLQIVQSSYDNPRIEDEDGRNGLHCLAEAIINQQTMDDQRTAMSTGRPLKRKHDKKDSPEGISGGGSSSSNNSSEGPLASRRRHLENLLHSRPPVDVNHYDKSGNTVLMSFIASIPDDQDDRAKTLGAILETLIAAGARVEARNRRGETALLVAARLGRKIALATLLERGGGGGGGAGSMGSKGGTGANVHARDVDGCGVLDVVDATCRAAGARDDLPLYARLEACRALLTGRGGWGVVQDPSVAMEWRVRGAGGDG